MFPATCEVADVVLPLLRGRGGGWPAAGAKARGWIFPPAHSDPQRDPSLSASDVPVKKALPPSSELGFKS